MGLSDANAPKARRRIIFDKLLRLAMLPVSVLLVEDGLDRPYCKKENIFITDGYALLEDAKNLTETFGFEWKKV